MAAKWREHAGVPEVFAFKVEFADDPDEGHSIDPEVGLSWGSFQIWIAGRNLCGHQEGDHYVDSVHWYLLPLLEFFAHNWNPLLHEERLPVQNGYDTGWESLRSTRFPPAAIDSVEEKASSWESEWQQWWSRHALRSASEGGLFPDIVLRRLRDSIEVSWGPARGVGMPTYFSFLEPTRGVRRLAPRDVAVPLHRVLSEAAAYLLSVSPQSCRISALVELLRDLNSEGEADRRLMWLAGQGGDEETVRIGWNRVKETIFRLGEPFRELLEVPDSSPLVISGSCHAALMFGSVSPEVVQQDILPLAQAMVDLSSSEGDSATMAAMSRSVPISVFDSPSWAQGYDLAETLHEDLDLAFVQGTSVDIEGLIGKLGVRVTSLELSDREIRGVSLAGPDHCPGIAINERYHPNEHDFGRRFTLAHELCHLLFDRQAGQRLALASGPWAPCDIEKRANAFAAMLLMPTALIHHAISGLAVPINTCAGVQAVARVLQAGVRSVLHHLMNTGFITDTDVVRIENEFIS